MQQKPRAEGLDGTVMATTRQGSTRMIGFPWLFPSFLMLLIPVQENAATSKG